MKETVLLLIGFGLTEELSEKIQSVIEEPVAFYDDLDSIYTNSHILERLKTLRQKHEHCMLVVWKPTNFDDIYMRVTACATFVWNEIPSIFTFEAKWDQRKNIFLFHDNWYSIK
jgi:hypothetical protein